MEMSELFTAENLLLCGQDGKLAISLNTCNKIKYGFIVIFNINILFEAESVQKQLLN